MKNATVHAKKLGPLIKKMAKQYSSGEDVAAARDPVSQVIYSFLEWESNRRSAELAMTRLIEIAVDHNDLRVCHTAELIEAMGQRYPLVEERAARLREVLNGIYMLEHDTLLTSVMDKSKRDIRQYLDGLPGMVPYVSSRMLLIVFGGHAIPVDERLVSLLDQAKVIEPDSTVEEVSSFLERHIKASDAMEAHLVFRRWADEAPAVKVKVRKVSVVKPVKVTKVVQEADVEETEIKKKSGVSKISGAGGSGGKPVKQAVVKGSKTSPIKTSKATGGTTTKKQAVKKTTTKGTASPKGKGLAKKAGGKSVESKTTKKKSIRKAKK